MVKIDAGVSPDCNKIEYIITNMSTKWKYIKRTMICLQTAMPLIMSASTYLLHIRKPSRKQSIMRITC